LFPSFALGREASFSEAEELSGVDENFAIPEMDKSSIF
jgi:hypothetical protein